jgi:hypothetical protein
MQMPLGSSLHVQGGVCSPMLSAYVPGSSLRVQGRLLFADA